MDEETYKLFIEDFNTVFDAYVINAQQIIKSPNPERELRDIKNSIHTLNADCSMLGIQNLADFFTAFEEVLNKVNLRNRKRISAVFDQALGIGFFKLREIAKYLEEESDLNNIEVVADIENLYQFAESNDL